MKKSPSPNPTAKTSGVMHLDVFEQDANKRISPLHESFGKGVRGNPFYKKGFPARFPHEKGIYSHDEHRS